MALSFLVGAVVVVAGASLVVVEAVSRENPPELLLHLARHLPVRPLPTDDDPARVVQHRQPTTPEHLAIREWRHFRHVTCLSNTVICGGIIQRDELFIININSKAGVVTSDFCCYQGVVWVRPGDEPPVLGLRGQGGICVVVVDNPGGRHGHVGHGHDHLRLALVRGASTVCYLGAGRVRK